MGKLINRNKAFGRLAVILLAGFCATACQDDIDNAYSRFDYNLEMNASSERVVLSENAPDDTTLTISWTAATNYGKNYITTYVYEVALVGGTVEQVIRQYVDEGDFSREYTNFQLQQLLVNRWDRLTSTTSELKFTITAETEGPTIVIPEISTVTIPVKTYGPTQFMADQLFMSGTAVGSSDVELSPTSSTSNLYVFNGSLNAGTINFPVVYDDEDKVNAISPLTARQEITTSAMDATIAPVASAGVWVVPEAGSYRVTVDLNAQQVTIVEAGEILEIDKLFLAGSAVTSSDIEIERTLEDDNLYAFRGELRAGSLFFPIEFEGATAMAIVPASESIADLSDGISVDFGQVETGTALNTAYWNIPADGTYRIVVDADYRRVTIYSAATDLEAKVVSWNNTVIGQNPYYEAIEKLWIWGGYNAFAGDGSGFTGFVEKYTLLPSLADPLVFVYKGEVLPRSTVTDNYGVSYTGGLNFAVSNINSNVYAFGADTDAVRNVRNGYLPVNHGVDYELIEGQGDNRYSYFTIPANTNFVVVDIRNLRVVFDSKE